VSPKITRRRFLGRTAAVLGSALPAPVIVPASALGRNGLLARGERIAMGFIGVGTQGGGHLLGGAWTYVAGGYAGRNDVQILAVCDIWRDRRERATQRVNDHYAEVHGQGSYKSCEAYNDFREVLARPDIDAVLIATPAHWHATMAAMAAAAGKDIYCEKPTAVTIQESQAMLAAVRRYGRVYQAGTQQRSEYGGKFRQACEFVRSGRIGKLKAIYRYREGGEGGACFVGTDGRIAVDRSALVSDPPNIVREPLRPDEVHLYRSDSHSGNFLHCVRTRQPTICNANVAHRAASALLLGGVA